MKHIFNATWVSRCATLMLAMLLALTSVNSQAADGPRFTAQSSMALILDNPAAREVMAKYIPEVMADPQIEGARVISIEELATYIPDQLTKEVIEKLLADLNSLPQ